MRSATLKAVAASVTNRKGGLPPAHVWQVAAFGRVCEGLNPIETVNNLQARRFDIRHDGHIERGERFLTKRWVRDTGEEFKTRHCDACGETLERRALDAEHEAKEAKLS